MISRNGIYYDLKQSIYRYKLDNITYVFSSLSHLQKFKMRYSDYRQKINESLSNRFNLDINVDRLADIICYIKVESRGFFIINDKGEEISCRKNLLLDGEKVMLKN